MSDMIASARAMTTVAEGQYNTLGLPKGSLTPATITAMVGFSQGKGLQMAPDISSAISKMQDHSMGVITGVAPGMTDALAEAGITKDTIMASTDTAATIQGIKDAAAAKGIMVDTASEAAMTNALGATTALSSFSSQMMAGGPAGFMQKFNQARAHIGDAIELKKVTAFCANAKLESFGSGITKMTDLVDQGLTSKLGNLSKVGDCLKATGGLFNMSDMGTFGTAAGLISKLNSTKMGNSTGINNMLTKTGVDSSRLNDPIYKDQIDKAMAKINDPKVLNAVAEQFDVNLPSGALPTVGTKNLTDGLKSAVGANPFSGLPSAGPDNSISNNAAGAILNRTSAAEPSANPQVWGGINDSNSFGKVSDKPTDPDLVKKIEELFQVVIQGSDVYVKAGLEVIDQYYSVDVKAPDADAQLAAINAAVKAKYGPIFEELQPKMYTAANEAGALINKLPISTSAQKIDRNMYSDQRSGPIEGLLKLTDQTNKNIPAAKKEVQAKIAAAKGGLSVTTT